MTLDRRAFLASSAAAAALAAAGRAGNAIPGRGPGSPRTAGGGYAPWLELYPEALRENARAVARLAAGRPVLAVVKNNGYGMGVGRVGRVLEDAPEVNGLAVVTPAEAHALRDAGVTKPILFMGLATVGDSIELARRGVRLAPFTDDAPGLLRDVSAAVGRPVPVHLYLDTGMGRLGMPVHRAIAWVAAIADGGHARVEGSFTALVEDDDFDRDQLARLRAFAGEAAARRLPLGRLHAASTHALFFRGGDALLDGVRPGLALYGAYPAGPDARARAELRPAFALRARVVRVERLRPGDGVSYGRNWVATRPTWVAALPVGHADGYPRRAIDGAEVLIGERTYPVIGAVSASHSIVELGEARGDAPVAIGDVATLVGPEHPAVHPNAVAERAGVSVYDILMHLSPLLPASG